MGFNPNLGLKVGDYCELCKKFLEQIDQLSNSKTPFWGFPSDLRDKDLPSISSRNLVPPLAAAMRPVLLAVAPTLNLRSWQFWTFLDIFQTLHDLMQSHSSPETAPFYKGVADVHWIMTLNILSHQWLFPSYLRLSMPFMQFAECHFYHICEVIFIAEVDYSSIAFVWSRL